MQHGTVTPKNVPSILKSVVEIGFYLLLDFTDSDRSEESRLVDRLCLGAKTVGQRDRKPFINKPEPSLEPLLRARITRMGSK